MSLYFFNKEYKIIFFFIIVFYFQYFSLLLGIITPECKSYNFMSKYTTFPKHLLHNQHLLNIDNYLRFCFLFFLFQLKTFFFLVDHYYPIFAILFLAWYFSILLYLNKVIRGLVYIRLILFFWSPMFIFYQGIYLRQ